MVRAVKVTLWRPRPLLRQRTEGRLRAFWRFVAPPWRRQVVVECLTVGRFLSLIDYALEKSAEVRLLALRVGRESISFGEILRAMTPQDFDFTAETMCPRERRAWFVSEWFSLPNTKALYAAFLDTNDWPKIRSVLDFSGQGAQKGGSIMGTIGRMCEIYPGLTVPEILNWYMDEFVDTCESLKAIAKQNVPASLDETVEPDPIPAFAKTPWVEVVH